MIKKDNWQLISSGSTSVFQFKVGRPRTVPCSDRIDTFPVFNSENYWRVVEIMTNQICFKQLLYFVVISELCDSRSVKWITCPPSMSAYWPWMLFTSDILLYSGGSWDKAREEKPPLKFQSGKKTKARVALNESKAEFQLILCSDYWLVLLHIV